MQLMKLKKSKSNIDFIGFHGQTIFHNAKEKISKQLGDGNLLSKLTKKTVIYNFRQNDLKNGGHGAPLTPIFHKLLKTKFKYQRSNIYKYRRNSKYTLLFQMIIKKYVRNWILVQEIV